MTIKQLLLATVAAVTLATSSLPLLAQETESEEAAPAAAQVSPEDNWLKICEPLDSGENACIMRQIVLQNGQFLGSFLLRIDPGQESRLMAVVAAPLGVLLPFGMTWQIDEGQSNRTQFVLCDPVSCSSQQAINEAYVNSLKRGGTLKLTAKNRQNQDIVIEINLAGFTAVYDSDASLSFEEFQAETTGASALEQVLQDRAEELRRQMGVDEANANASTDENTAAE